MEINIDGVKKMGWKSFDAIFDVRSEKEFEDDHIPGALNYPVLNNEERVEVGTMYKHNRFKAKKYGAQLISKRIAGILEHAPILENPSSKILAYCWRGGERSNSLSTVLSRIGYQIFVLTGGYKAYRHHVMEELSAIGDKLKLCVIDGATGVGKGELLSVLKEHGHQTIDLEQLANHGGSAFGQHATLPQPTQKYFESLLLQAFQEFDWRKAIYLEAESTRIGNVYLPKSLLHAMREGQNTKRIQLQLNIDDRVRRTRANYKHLEEEQNRDMLLQNLMKLRPIVGGERVELWKQLVEQREFDQLVRELLLHHYDKRYRQQQQSRKEIVTEGEQQLSSEGAAAVAGAAVVEQEKGGSEIRVEGSIADDSCTMALTARNATREAYVEVMHRLLTCCST